MHVFESILSAASACALVALQLHSDANAAAAEGAEALSADLLVEKSAERAYKVRELRSDGVPVDADHVPPRNDVPKLVVVDLDYSADGGAVVFASRDAARTRRVQVRYAVRPTAD